MKAPWSHRPKALAGSRVSSCWWHGLLADRCPQVELRPSANVMTSPDLSPHGSFTAFRNVAHSACHWPLHGLKEHESHCSLAPRACVSGRAADGGPASPSASPFKVIHSRASGAPVPNLAVRQGDEPHEGQLGRTGGRAFEPKRA